MGALYEGYTMGSILALILFIAICVGINEVTRKSKTASIAVYCVLPVIVGILIFTDVLGSPTGKTWFAWVKVVSALAGVYGFMLIRFTKIGEKKKFVAIFPYAILALNILEAVYREFQIFATYKEMVVDPGGMVVLGGVWNILNGTAGILCILTLTGFVGIKISQDDSRDLVWPDMTWMYIIGYTLWNYSYVYSGISGRSMYAGFGILLAALISEFVFKKGVWLQHRAQILSVYVLFSLAFDFQKSSYFQIVPTYQENMWLLVATISFVFNVGVFVHMLYTMKKYSKNPLKEEVYTHTAYYQEVLKANNIA